MRRYLVFLISLVLSIYCFVASAMVVPSFNATRSNGFSLGVSGYYLPFRSNGYLDYALLTSNTGFDSVSTNPRYRLGWGITVGYLIPCSCADIIGNYFHTDSDYKKSITATGLDAITPVTNQFNFPLSNPSTLSTTYRNRADTRFNYAISQADLSIGERVNVGCGFSFHPFIGVSWLELKTHLDASYAQSAIANLTTPLAQAQSLTFKEKSRFQGIGPWAGIDTSYCLGCGFSLVERLSTGLLSGSTRASTSALAQQNYGVPGSVINVASGAVDFKSRTRNNVVAVMDLRLGGSYTWNFCYCGCAQSWVTLEGGWMVNYYLNAADRLTTQTILQNTTENNTGAPLINAANVTGQCSYNINVNGPYLSLVFHL